MEPPFDQALFEQAIAAGKILWRKHALEKMFARGIERAEVVEVLKSGDVIQQYGYDRPFPSVLLVGFPANRPIHVVAALDEGSEQVYVITVYEPDQTIFEPDFKTKRK